MNNLFPSAAAQNEEVKRRRLVFEFTITGNATSANKKFASDISDTVYVRAAGQTATADALDSSVSWTTPVDSTGTFGILLDTSKVGATVTSTSTAGSLSKVLLIKASETSTATAGTITVTKHGTGGLSTSGNIAFTLACGSLDLTGANTAKICVEVEYLLSR